MIFGDRTIDLNPYLETVAELEGQEVHWATKWRSDVMARAINGDHIEGARLPWSKTHDHVRLRPGELSIWAGINGHRKSMLVGQVMLWLSKEPDTRICIASLEMRPVETLWRMATQAAGCQPDPVWCASFLEGSNGRICLYDQLDTVEATRIVAMIHYVANELKCSHIVIDSLVKCGIAGDDYTGQKKFVDRLQWAAKTYGCHIHLICHMRKGQDENHRPGKFDVRGASEITDLADNVFIVWKDKEREDAIRHQDLGLTLRPAHLEALDRPDQILEVAKQRHGSFEGRFSLWFHKRSLQFLGSNEGRAMPWPNPNQDLETWKACPVFGDHYKRLSNESNGSPLVS